MSLKISVVIPTYNSKDLLNRCLVSLEKQTAPLSAFEVIVIDDGSNDRTFEMLEAFATKTSLKLKSQHIPNSGPASARNLGVSHAEADWVAFLDADVIAHEDWVQRALDLIEKSPNLAGFEGRTIVSERHKLTPFTHQTENFYGGRYPTCNMVLRKIYCQFYTKYRIPFREDTDLAFCILESGRTIQFDEELIVYHPPLAANYLRPLKLAARYEYDGLLRRRFPRRYRNSLDAHPFLGIPIPHIKQKVYGVFLLTQILFVLGGLTLPWDSGEFVTISSIFLISYLLTWWMGIRNTLPTSRGLKDQLVLAGVILAVPWVMYLHLFKGFLQFRHEKPFSSSEWLKSLGFPVENRPYEIVLISTADWDHPFWTNKQHISSRLAKNGSHILYIESLGLRQLTTTYRDFKRIYQRLRRSLLGFREVQPNVYVWSPLVIPLHRFRLVRYLNWVILGQFIQYFCKKLNFQNPILWSYNPIVGALTEHLNFSHIVYHCVDELKEAPGMPVKILEAQEQKFSEQADIIFTTSPNLYETRKRWNTNTYYLPNPCDFDHFNKTTSDITVASVLQHIPQPCLGFVGAISHYKVNAELLKRIAQHSPEWQLILLGQIGEGEPGARFDELFDLPNVHFLGPKPYGELPHYLKGCQVALLPSPINGYTQSMFPLKFFEYLAAGLPVVSTALSALEAYRDVCYWCETDQEFITAIPKALEDYRLRSDRIQKGIQLAKENTWDKRVESMLETLAQHFAQP